VIGPATPTETGRTGWWSLCGLLLTKILRIGLAYLAAVLVGLLAVVLVSSLASIAGAPSPFLGLGIPPFLALLVPPVGLLIYLVALIVAAGPALFAVIVTEGLALRQPWLHSLLGAAVSAATYAWQMSTTLLGLAGHDYADSAIMAAGGLFGGLAYWLIAGRRAGVGEQ